MTGVRYELRFRPAALRQLRKLDSQTARRIKNATESLRTELRPHGVKTLTDRYGWLRIRVGDYRIVYEVRDSELVVLVIQIGHRSRAAHPVTTSAHCSADVGGADEGLCGSATAEDPGVCSLGRTPCLRGDVARASCRRSWSES